jgi:hypothetical protein
MLRQLDQARQIGAAATLIARSSSGASALRQVNHRPASTRFKCGMGIDP